jgi:hypothetical protein
MIVKGSTIGLAAGGASAAHNVVCKMTAMAASTLRKYLVPPRMFSALQASLAQIKMPQPPINSRKSTPALVFWQPIRFL